MKSKYGYKKAEEKTGFKDRKIKAGIIGCGNISGIYFKNLKDCDILDITSCADLDIKRAKAISEEFNISKSCNVKELINDPEIEIVINLTVPKAHAEVSLEVIEAGKSVYSEKPLAITLEDAKKIIESARKKGVLAGCAPDTFLGGGLQTCRKIIDDGLIGRPIAATAFFASHGPEHFHPNPDIFYQIGAGPMFDMGPYYITALVSLIGGVKRVTAASKVTFKERTITSQPNYGKKIKVETPTHITGIMDFHNGAVGTVITSFDVWGSQLPCIEIYGTEGTLSVPDPDKFRGPVRIKSKNTKDWIDAPLSHLYNENSRGIGVIDMAYSLINKRTQRVSADLAYHVLEVMTAFLESDRKGGYIELKSRCNRPEPLPDILKTFKWD